MSGPRPTAVKIVVAGGFGVGKTTLVGAVSEITPLTTEAPMTEHSAGIDDTSLVGSKSTTTVALDFGRITLGKDLLLYLFGTPGQERFWYMWDDLARGAIGAVVLADPRRLQDCFGAIDFFEDRSVPYIVAVNRFPGSEAHDDEALRDALALGGHVPLVRCDARVRSSAKEVLIALLHHALRAAGAPVGAGGRRG